MYVYLIQHAEAKSKEDDPERGLTSDGIKSVKKICKFLSKSNKLKSCISEIWHSQKKRAKQTAEIMASSLGLKKRLVEHANLAPNDDVSNVKGDLQSFKQEGYFKTGLEKHNIAIVGHLPYLSRLASSLFEIDETKEIIKFRNAGIICLIREEKSWKLNWIINYEIIK